MNIELDSVSSICVQKYLIYQVLISQKGYAIAKVPRHVWDMQYPNA